MLGVAVGTIPNLEVVTGAAACFPFTCGSELTRSNLYQFIAAPIAYEAL